MYKTKKWIAINEIKLNGKIKDLALKRNKSDVHDNTLISARMRRLPDSAALDRLESTPLKDGKDAQEMLGSQMEAGAAKVEKPVNASEKY